MRSRPRLRAAVLVCTGIMLLASTIGRGQETPEPPVVLMGCVTGGNPQPVEEPFVLVASQPFVLKDVVTMDHEKAPSEYRVTGMNLIPWLGLRVKVEGTIMPKAAGASGLPEIKARRVYSIWGTCPSPPAWTPSAPTGEQ